MIIIKELYEVLQMPFKVVRIITMLITVMPILVYCDYYRLFVDIGLVWIQSLTD